MRYITQIFASALILLMSTISCSKQAIMEDCICATQAAIPISIDWTKAGFEPQNVSVLLYNSSDGTLALEHQFEHNDNDVQSYLYAPIGSYTAVIFNEIRNQIEYLSTEGYENISTLKFVTQSSSSAIARSESLTYIEQPGDLAVMVIDDFEITEEVVLYTAGLKSGDEVTVKSSSNVTKSISEALMNIEPSNKVNWMTIVAHIDGINNARMPALIDLSNISDGYSVVDDRNSTNPAKVQFTMNNRTYDEGSTTDGTISSTIALFGALGDRFSTKEHTDETPIMLDMLFMLVDAEQTLIEYSQDITDLIIFEQVNGETRINLSLEINLDEPLPDVVPEGWEDSGFTTESNDWTEVDVPLING